MTYIMVSVIIPCYNRREYIGMTLDSCLKQAEISEIIVVDDGSSDGTIDIVNEFAAKDNRVRLTTHAHNRNLGTGTSRNLGLSLVTNPFFSFLDSDDIYQPERFDKLLAMLSNDNNLDVVCDNVFSYDQTLANRIQERDFIWQGMSDIDFEQLLSGLPHNRISIIGLLIRRKTAGQLRFASDLHIAEDTDYLWQLSRHLKIRHAGYSESYVKRRIHPTNITKDEKKHRHCCKLLYQKWYRKSLTEADLKSYRWYFFRHYAHWLGVNKYGINASIWQKALSYIEVMAKTPSLLAGRVLSGVSR